MSKTNEKMFYKIRDKDNLFSNGGRGPVILFNSRGKIWISLGALRSHISHLNENIKRYKINGGKDIIIEHPYLDCEIVEYILVEKSIIPAIEELLASHERKVSKKRRYSH